MITFSPNSKPCGGLVSAPSGSGVVIPVIPSIVPISTDFLALDPQN